MVILGYPGVQALDVVGPFDVFTGATLSLAATGKPERGYDVTIASLGGEPVTTGTGLTLLASPLPDPDGTIDTVVLPGGFGLDEARKDSDIVDWVKSVAGTARRVISVCTGAFLAAQAGLLDGCRATTHWAFAGELAREFPSVTVDPEPIYVRSSPTVWTAAGVTAGIDLALSLVEDDHGTDVAQTVARYLVLYLRRPGGQTQFAAPIWMPRAKRAPIRDVQADHRSRTRCNAQYFRVGRSCGDEPATFLTSVHPRSRRGAWRLRRTHPNRGRAQATGGDRRHPYRDRHPLRLRHGRHHAAQFYSENGHFARPVSQDLRLTDKGESCRSPSCCTPASPRWTSSDPTRACVGFPTPKSDSSGTSQVQSQRTRVCSLSGRRIRSPKHPLPTSFWCPAGSRRSSMPATRRSSTGCAGRMRARPGRHRYVLARSCSPPQGCWRASAPRRIGRRCPR